jgi:hypothetical protein
VLSRFGGYDDRRALCGAWSDADNSIFHNDKSHYSKHLKAKLQLQLIPDAK